MGFAKVCILLECLKTGFLVQPGLMMCMYAPIYIYTYTCISVYVCEHTHTYVYIYICVHLYLCMYVCMYVCVNSFTCHLFVELINFVLVYACLVQSFLETPSFWVGVFACNCRALPGA